MTALSAIAALFATALLFGGMVFFAAVVAPAGVPRPRATCGRSVPAPPLPGLLRVGSGARRERVRLAFLPILWEASLILAVVCAGFVFAREALMPRINAWRDRELAGDAIRPSTLRAGSTGSPSRSTSRRWRWSA
ncbi:MAG: hypothetical protein RML45_13000 [Acetobacteraceae bacterium]|nr:hypothetical protein [Acetobacteraceae bacterium]